MKHTHINEHIYSDPLPITGTQLYLGYYQLIFFLETDFARCKVMKTNVGPGFCLKLNLHIPHP